MKVGRLITLLLIAASLVCVPASAANDKMIRAVRGVVGYEVTGTTDFKRVVGQFVLNDNNDAVTQFRSNALVTLPDSSEVALGPNTTVSMSAFNDPASSTPTSVTLKTGSVRFAIKRPAGGHSNYVFSGTSSQLAVRGTIGLFSTGPAGDTIVCLSCEPGDVTVTVGSKTIGLLTGQVLFVSLIGAATSAAVSTAALQSFQSAGLSTSSTSASSFASGVSSSAGVSGASTAVGTAAQGTVAASTIVTTAVATVTTAVVVAANKSSAPPSLPPTPSPSPTQSGSVAVTERARATAPAVTPSPSPSPSPSPTPKRKL